MPIEFTMAPPSTLKVDPALRTTLLEYFVTYATGPELTDWLKNIGQDSKGTTEERRARVVANSKYPSMPPEEFPQQTLHYLESYSASEHLSGICEVLGLSTEDKRELRWRRIMREVGVREGWLPRLDSITDTSLTTLLSRPFIEWHLVTKRPEYERDFYPPFFEDMEETFGHTHVHEQLPIAFGSTLKIDFHLGHPQREGVGIEVKMPANNSDLQRALGQMDQYQTRYRDQLLVVLLPDLLNKAQVTLFVDKLNEKGISVIIK
jgi:hypothetical protein